MNLRERRTELGLSQCDVADMAQVPQVMVSYWERHKPKRKNRTRAAILKALREAKNATGRPVTNADRDSEIRRLVREGATHQDIANQFGISRGRAAQIAPVGKDRAWRTRGDSWTHHDDARAEALRANGQSASEIGAAIGKPRNAVLGRKHRSENAALKEQVDQLRRENARLEQELDAVRFNASQSKPSLLSRMFGGAA